MHETREYSINHQSDCMLVGCCRVPRRAGVHAGVAVSCGKRKGNDFPSMACALELDDAPEVASSRLQSLHCSCCCSIGR